MVASLWLDAVARARFLDLASQSESPGADILAAARRATASEATSAEGEPDRCVVALALIAVIDSDTVAARRAAESFLAWTATANPSDLGGAHQALVAAVVWDCCADLCDDALRYAMGTRAAELAASMREINSGNPHVVTNNWWAVTHSGALLASRVAEAAGIEVIGGWPVGEALTWARGRLVAFAGHFGDAGLYHEGLGYQLYTCSLLLAAVTVDAPLAAAVGVRFAPMAASLFATAVAAPAAAEEPRAPAGIMLSWNDAGLGWGQVGAVPLMVSLAPSAQQGALRWCLDRLHGASGQWPQRFAGWFFTLLAYPTVPAVDPAGVLPTTVCDHRQGLVVWRDGWTVSGDTVVGLYAKTTHLGGHRQQDAGSLRLLAGGRTWIAGGGQARADRRWQSVCMPADGGDPDACGAILAYDAAAGVIGVELRKVSQCYHERWLTCAGGEALGVQAGLLLLDQIEDHRQRSWLWTLTLIDPVTVTIAEDQRSCQVHGVGGAVLTVTFVGTLPQQIALERMPESTRTFSGGDRVTYPGRPVLVATFAPAIHHGILAVITVDPSPALQVSREQWTIQRGEQRWERPFGCHVPAEYMPGQSPSLCRAPAGHAGYRARPE